MFNFHEDNTCEIIKFSKHASYKSSHIDQEEHDRATSYHLHSPLELHRLHQKHEKISLSFEESILAELLCDPESFYPNVSELESEIRFTCSQVCQRCVPGSYPVCYMKNRRFPGVAQTCLCTYSHEDPIQKAVLSLRHGYRGK